MIFDMVQVMFQDEFGIMRTELEEQRTTRSRSWSGREPEFNFKLLTLALLACMLFLKPASAINRFNCNSDSPSTHDVLDRRTTGNLDSLGSLRKQQVARRTLLQGGMFRPSPTGYPPPGDNQQAVPRRPSFRHRPP